MKKSFVFGAVLALALAACGDDSPSSSNSVDPELESSSSVDETPSSSSEKSSSSSKKSKDSSSSNKVSESSSSVEQESSSSEKVQSSSEAVEESSSSQSADTTAVNSSSSTEEASSSSGPQELDVEVSTRCFADYPMGKVPTPATKAYMQPDSNGRYSGTLYYVVDNCNRLVEHFCRYLDLRTIVYVSDIKLIHSYFCAVHITFYRLIKVHLIS